MRKKSRDTLPDDKQNANNEWNRVYTDLLNGHVDKDRLIFAITQLNNLDKRIINQRRRELL